LQEPKEPSDRCCRFRKRLRGRGRTERPGSRCCRFERWLRDHQLRAQPEREPEKAWVIRAPGQLKRLGTDAFTALAAWEIQLRSCWFFREVTAKSSEGVRSRQKTISCASLLLCISDDSHGCWMCRCARGGATTGSEILESRDERNFVLHSLNASVRGSGSNCLIYASGF